MRLCVVSCKVFIPEPTWIKLNHPRRTHKKHLRNGYQCHYVRKKEREKRKHHDSSTEACDRHMGPATTQNKHYTKCSASRVPPALSQQVLSTVSVASWASGHHSMSPCAWPLCQLVAVKTTSPATAEPLETLLLRDSSVVHA